MENEQKMRVMADMSVTVLHHGHIHLLKKAKLLGTVVVALTKDEEIRDCKGFNSFLKYNHRKEILESIKYVDEVVPSDWLITEDFLDLHNCDILIHGDDNSNPIPENRLHIIPKIPNISSSMIRKDS